MTENKTGLILLDKPQGFTSFKAAAAIRRIHGIKRVGHTGTLDPMATGVLPILIGRATRLCSFCLDADKRYTATVILGVTTDTLDITGKILSESPVNVTDDELNKAIEKFKGIYDQIPPMFSAISKNGVRMYDLARQGIEVERTPRRVNIKKINLLWRDGNTFAIDVLCSKGTYIRSLADDLGKFLGTGAVLSGLRRTKTAQFSIDECAKLEDIEKNPEKYLLSAEKIVEYLPKVYITAPQKNRFLHGAPLDLGRVTPETFAENSLVRVCESETFLGLGEIKETSIYTKCVIND